MTDENWAVLYSQKGKSCGQMRTFPTSKAAQRFKNLIECQEGISKVYGPADMRGCLRAGLSGCLRGHF